MSELIGTNWIFRSVDRGLELFYGSRELGHGAGSDSVPNWVAQPPRPGPLPTPSLQSSISHQAVMFHSSHSFVSLPILLHTKRFQYVLMVEVGNQVGEC